MINCGLKPLFLFFPCFSLSPWCYRDMGGGSAPRNPIDGGSMIVHVCNLPSNNKTTGEFWQNKEISPLFTLQ
jgi:hypothetical protein